MNLQKYNGYTLEQLLNTYQMIIKKINITTGVTLASQIPSLLNSNTVLSSGVADLGTLGIIILAFYGYKLVALKKKYDKLIFNSKEYQDVDKLYLYLLKDLSKMLKELDFSESHKIFASYSYLLNSGYLSNKHKFIYSTEYNLFNKHIGSSIVEGKGCCRHIATALTDLLKQSDYTAYNLSIKLPAHVYVLKNKKLLKEEISQEELENLPKDSNHQNITISKKRLVDHLTTIVVDNNNSIIYDPTNNTFFIIDENQKVYNSGEVEPVIYEASRNNYETRKLSSLLKKTDLQIFNDMWNDYSRTVSICKENEDVFEKFYTEHKDLYEDIVNKRKILIKEYKQNYPYESK